MTTAAEALAACLALGTPRDVCEEKVKSQSVGGVYCDGTIVLEVGQAPRCVPRTVTAAKQAAARVPTAAPERAAAADGGAAWALVVVGVVVVAGAAWLVMRSR